MCDRRRQRRIRRRARNRPQHFHLSRMTGAAPGYYATPRRSRTVDTAHRRPTPLTHLFGNGHQRRVAPATACVCEFRQRPAPTIRAEKLAQPTHRNTFPSHRRSSPPTSNRNGSCQQPTLPTCLGRIRLEWAARPGRPPVEGQAIRNALRAIGVQQKIMLTFMSERRTYGCAGTMLVAAPCLNF